MSINSRSKNISERRYEEHGDPGVHGNYEYNQKVEMKNDIIDLAKDIQDLNNVIDELIRGHSSVLEAVKTLKDLVEGIVHDKNK